MFTRNDFETIGEDIYVFHNFISDEICNSICKDAELLKDDDWNVFDYKRYISKVYVSDQLEIVKNKVFSLLTNGLAVGEGLSVQKVCKGGYFNEHTDDMEFKNVINAANSYIDGQEFELARSNAFGFIVYLNDFEGGEIEYPNQAIKYKPLKGDLLIHGSHDNCLHRVTEVTSDVRWVYASNIFEMLKVPKGFKNVA